MNSRNSTVIVVLSQLETDGNKEYWTCENCGKYFSDAEGKNKIKLADIVIDAKDHETTELKIRRIPPAPQKAIPAIKYARIVELCLKKEQ